MVALYVLDPIPLASAGGFRRTQLLAHLHGLNECLGRQGGCLMVRTGTPAVVVPEVAAACGAGTVHANADVTPYSRRRDEAVARRLGDAFVLWWGNLVHPPNTVVTAKKQTPRVFTPFFTRWSQLPLPVWPEVAPVEVDADPGGGLPAVESEPFQVGAKEPL